MKGTSYDSLIVGSREPEQLVASLGFVYANYGSPWRNDPIQNLLENIRSLVRMHAIGLLGGEVMPEDALLGIVPADEMENVLTLAMSLNYQRSAYALWQSVAQAFQDEDCRFVFSPIEVVQRSQDELRVALLKHAVALQPNRHPDIWKRVAGGIVKHSPTQDVPGLIRVADSDVAVLSGILQGKNKADFPYLSGPKIFNYWLYVMETFGGIQWKHRELITIAPDTHVLKATVRLGLCGAEVLNASAADRQTVAAAWAGILKGTELAPVDVHTPLWLWSRAGFPALQTVTTTLNGGTRQELI